MNQIRTTFLLPLMACLGILGASAMLQGCGARRPDPATTTDKPDGKCRNTTACSIEGKCTEQQGSCVAATDVDCKASENCATKGLCVANAGACVATDDTCFASMGCIGIGGPQNQCAASNGRCIALTASNEPDANRRCRYSYECRHWGECTYDGKECVRASDRDCRISESDCPFDGHCGFRDGKCVAVSEKDCKTSGQCRGSGICGFKADTCVATVDGCAQSRDCRSLGSCSVRGDRCAAATNADCEKSQACLADGRCIVSPKPPANASGSLCIAGNDAQCRAALVCKRLGRCEAHENDAEFGEFGQPRRCAVDRNEDCVAASICAALGLCAAQNGECRATEASCRSSEACSKRGECALDDGHCVAKSDTDCRASADCKAFGRCTLEGKRCGKESPCEEASRHLVNDCHFGQDLEIAVAERAGGGCIGDAYCLARCSLDLPCAAIEKDGTGARMQECLVICAETLPTHLQGAE